jgi:prevent-host-death family protein
MRRWQLQKAKLSELIRSAEREGPQEISVRGEAVAVMVSMKDYDRLRGPRPSLVEFLRGSPLMGVELEIDRDQTPLRDVKL